MPHCMHSRVTYCPLGDGNKKKLHHGQFEEQSWCSYLNLLSHHLCLGMRASIYIHAHGSGCFSSQVKKEQSLKFALASNITSQVTQQITISIIYLNIPALVNSNLGAISIYF